MEFARDAEPSRPSSLPLEPARVSCACREAVAAIDSAKTPAEALERVVETLHEQLDSAFVAALVVEHGRLWVVASCGFGFAVTPDAIPLNVGVVGRAARTGRVQYVPDLEADPSYVEVVRAVSSEIAIPLLVRGEVVGVVNIETGSPLPRQTARLLRPLGEALAPVLEVVRNQRTLDLSGLARLFVHVSSLRDPREISEIVVGALPRILPVETGQLYLRAENGSIELVFAQRGSAEAPEPLSEEAAAALCDCTGPTTVIEKVDLASLRGELGELSARTAVLLPLRANGDDLGVLIATSRWPQQYTREHAEVASLLAAQGAAAIDAALSLVRERRSALTDPLTSLLNRRGFELELEAALVVAEEKRLPLSVWVLDCDDFKEVNDRAGHEFGDALLREVGQVLGSVVPETASAGRLGGDEFVVMLPGTDSAAAELVVADIGVRLSEGLVDAGFPLRISGGIATYPFDGGSGSQLVRAADQALYEAKETGKNRVVGFRELVREGSRSSSAGASREIARARPGPHATVMLVEAAEAATAISRETTQAAVLERLSKTMTFVVGATGCNLSRVIGDALFDVTAHSLRDVDLASGKSYLIGDFPVTKACLDSGKPLAISFLDADLDRAEAFILRELKMNCALLLPIVVDDQPWGLAELYDMRLRRFSREQEAIAKFLVDVAARRIETLGSQPLRQTLLPVRRPPDAR